MERTCYIVDNEHHDMELLVDFVSQTPKLTLKGYSSNPITALTEMSAGPPPDITFVDVQMPQLSGLQLAEMISANTIVIITSAFGDYALEAFEKQVFDYLLKPISYGRFLKSIYKIERCTSQLSKAGSLFDSFIFIKTGLKNQFTRIAISDIQYILGALNYIELYLKDRRVVTYMSLKSILEKLPSANFSRVHKSYIVNDNLVQTLEYGQLIMSDMTIIPIGRSYRKQFHQKMKISFTKGIYEDG